MVFQAVGLPAYAEAPPDTDNDNDPDHTDPCPYDATNSCFMGCIALEMEATWLQLIACGSVVSVAGTVAVISTGGVGAKFAAAGFAAAIKAGLKITAIMGIFGFVCACAFHMAGL